MPRLRGRSRAAGGPGCIWQGYQWPWDPFQAVSGPIARCRFRAPGIWGGINADRGYVFQPPAYPLIFPLSFLFAPLLFAQTFSEMADDGRTVVNSGIDTNDMDSLLDGPRQATRPASERPDRQGVRPGADSLIHPSQWHRSSSVPGQQPNSGGRARAGTAAGAAPGRARPSAAQVTRVLGASRAWRAQRPAQAQDLRAVEGLRVQHLLAEADSERQRVLDLAADSFMFHPCVFPEVVAAQVEAARLPPAERAAFVAAAVDSLRHRIAQVPSKHEVVYQGAHCSFTLPVPMLRCTDPHCPDPLHEARPCHLLCWPSSPSSIVDVSQPGPSGVSPQGHSRWISFDLLNDFARLNNGGGLSICAYCAYLEAKGADIAAYAAIFGTSHEQHVLGHKQMGEAYWSYMRAASVNKAYLRKDVPFNIGVMRDCPACSTWLESDGSRNYSENVWICLDGSVTFKETEGTAKAGREAGLDGEIRDFFSAANDLHRAHLAGGGARNADAEEREAGPQQRALAAAEQAFAGEHNPIGCCRPGAGAKPVDPGAPSFGVVAACCGHNFAAHGQGVNTRGPEAFNHHTSIYESAVVTNEDDKIERVSLDYSCLISGHLYNVFMDNKWTGAACREDIILVVDWLHARGHKPICRFKNGAMYISGTGRIIGAQMEQLWSWVSCRVVRRMMVSLRMSY